MYLPPCDQSFCQFSNDLDETVNAIKDKMQISSKRETIRLLTRAPSSWTIEKTN